MATAGPGPGTRGHRHRDHGQVCIPCLLPTTNLPPAYPASRLLPPASCLLPSTTCLLPTTATARFGNGQGAEYAESYLLEYWRPRLGRWVRYRDRDNSEVMPGNTNTYLAIKQELRPVVLASKVQVVVGVVGVVVVKVVVRVVVVVVGSNCRKVVVLLVALVMYVERGEEYGRG